MVRRKGRKKTYLIRIDTFVKDGLDEIKAGSPFINLSYNDILISLLLDNRKNKAK
jgi:hypothetical protein